MAKEMVASYSAWQGTTGVLNALNLAAKFIQNKDRMINTGIVIWDLLQKDNEGRVGLRAFADLIGADISWDNEGRVATVIQNGSPYYYRASVYSIVNNRVMVELSKLISDFYMQKSSQVQIGNYPAYGSLTAEQRAEYNNAIYQNKPAELWPLGGNTWTKWNEYLTYNDTKKPHGGNNIAAPTGTEIYSIYYGVAHTTTETNDKGEISGGSHYVYVVSNINGETITISYMHMTEWAITSGTEVAPGTLIGYVGQTGSATGPHLHL